MDPPSPSLLELQNAVRQHLLQRADRDACAHVIAGGLDPAERLDIYRNTIAGGLIKALQLSYPAVQHLVGGEFFEGAARLFIRESLPHAAWLDVYGSAFPEFLAQLPQCASLVYLSDVARLEWHINTVLHAPDAKPMALTRLAQLAEAELGCLRFEPHPAVRLFRSAFPLDAIWRAVLERDEDAMAAIDLASGPVWLLISLSETGIDVSRLNECEWRFTAALLARRPLHEVLAQCPCAGADALLAAHLARGRFIDATPVDPRAF